MDKRIDHVIASIMSLALVLLMTPMVPITASAADESSETTVSTDADTATEAVSDTDATTAATSETSAESTTQETATVPDTTDSTEVTTNDQAASSSTSPEASDVSATTDDPATSDVGKAAVVTPTPGSDIDNSTTLADGTYTPEAFTHRISAENSADITIDCTQVVVRDGKAYAQVVFGDPTLNWVLAGSKTITDKTAGDTVTTFEIPVDLNGDTTVAVGSETDSQTGSYIITVTLSEPAASGTADGTVKDPTSTDTAQTADVATASATTATTGDSPALLAESVYGTVITPQAITTNTSVPTGTYTLAGGYKSGMFRIVDCTVTSVDGAMTADIKLSGTGQTYLYLGSAAEATAAGLGSAIAATSTTATNSEGKTCCEFSIPLSALDKDISIAAYSPKTATWYDRTINISSAKLTDTSTSTAATTVQVAPTGTYTLAGGYKSGMFRIVDCTVTSVDGAMTADIKLSGTGQTYLYLGSAAEATAAGLGSAIAATSTTATNSEGKTCCEFSIPLSALDKDISIAAYSPKTATWYDRTINISSAKLYAPVSVSYAFASGTSGMSLPSGVTGQLGTPATTTSSAASISNEFASTTYSSVRVTDANGGLEGTWTFSGWDNSSANNTGDPVTFTGTWTYSAAGSYPISYRFVSATSGMTLPTGVTSQLSSATSTSALEGANVTNEFASTKYLDVNVSSSPKGTWTFSGWDATSATESTSGITFTGSWTFTKSASDDSGNTGGDTGGNTGGSGNADNSADSGSYDSSTTLADGTYTPDSFSWGGGSGRLAGMTCTQIVVRGGQAWATIVFQSGSYTQVSANGGIYDNLTPGSGVSTFEIPVALNQNNTISGLTTAMSAPHWVSYSIFVGLAAAGSGSGAGSTIGNSNALDETAPTIAGLTFQSETKIEYAKYFKIYNYDQGITLIEIDMATDTAYADATATSSTTGTSSTSTSTTSASSTSASASATSSDESASSASTSDAAIKAELYKGNVIKYLVVPAGVEIPAGLDKEVIVIQQPADKTFVASSQALATMDQLGLTSDITSVGIASDKITTASVSQAITDKKITVTGSYDDPAYKDLVSEGCNLVIQDEALIPHISKDKVTSVTSNDAIQPDSDDKDLTVDEQLKRFDDMGARFATLNVPMLVDRSADEQAGLAQAEWVKVYGAIYGCSDQADQAFAAAKTAAGV